MEILSIIPARGGSKGIKRKNIKPILNKPLIAYTIEASLKSKYITRTILSSEDDEILSIAKDFGAEVLKRPLELAQDETKTAPVILNVMDNLQKTGYKAVYVVLLQPTCPLRDEKYIDLAFDYYFSKQKEGFDSCFSVYEIGNTHAYWKLLHNGKSECLYDYRKRPRRQDVNEHYKLYRENGAFYALPWDTVRETKDFIGYNPVMYNTPKMIDIDTVSDFEEVEKIILERNKNA